MIVTRPSRAVDLALEGARLGRGRPATKPLLDLLAKAVYAVRGLDPGHGGVTFMDLGRRRLKQADRQYVTAVLLRLLAANPHAVDDSTLRGYFREIIESVPERLVTALNLPADTLEHRIVELPGVVPAAEERVEQTFRLLTGVESVRRFQTEFLRSLQDPFVLAGIRPFLSNELVEVGFPAVARAIIDCTDLTSEDAFDRVEAARRHLQQFDEEVRALDTKYAETYLGGIVSSLRDDLEKRFEASPLSHPASLRLVGGRKRLPLHREGVELDIHLMIANEGKGPAIAVNIHFEPSGAVEALESEHFIGFVPPKGRNVTVPTLVMEACSAASLLYSMEWRNADGVVREFVGEVILDAQDPSIDWEGLQASNPYPGHAIKDDRLLAGRDQLLEELTALATGPEVGSTRISGEKRIGKSSLVRSLETRLNRTPTRTLLTAYIDINKLGVPTDDAKRAMGSIMRATAKQLQAGEPTLASVPIPGSAEDDVEWFASYLESVVDQLQGRRVLIVFDEFDELPNAVFDRGGPGDAFFRAMKAYSSEGNCGFFLVGGERLELALSRQHDRLNAFREHRIDYIGRERIEDFEELVQRPVKGFLEFDGEAIEDLHRRTAGHPHYTLLVCREILARAQELRDNHVTVTEVDEAYAVALQKAPATAFAHIWFDHVFGDSEELKAIADRRLVVLLAWTALMRSGVPATETTLIEECRKYELSAIRVREELHELVTRGLIKKTEEGTIGATCGFFQDWLREWGPERLRTDADTSATLKRVEEEEDKLRVRSDEIRDLRDSWPLYQARRVDSEDIRAWLDQFPGPREHRLAFQVLRRVEFLRNMQLKDFYEAVHAEARKDTKIVYEPSKRARREFAVVYAENDGKSASLMSKLYAHANQIHSSCVVNIERLPNLLEAQRFQRVVIIDDFVGTGNTAIRRLDEHSEIINQAAEHTGRQVVFGAAVAFQEGQQRIVEWIRDEKLPVHVAEGKMLFDSDKCFHESAGVFELDDDRVVARRLFEDLARRMGSTEPLGTGNLEALIVFEHNCPNNSLPLLWKRSESWRPLFERTRASG
jgi:hypothetical protein